MSEIRDMDIAKEIGQLLADKYDGVHSFLCFAITPTGIHIEATQNQNSLALLRCAIDLLNITHTQLAEKLDER